MATPDDPAPVTDVPLAGTRPSAEASLPEITPAGQAEVHLSGTTSASPVIWQTNYERHGVNYWVDMPLHVSQALEWAFDVQASATIPWTWCWNPQDEPHLRVFNRYILEPTAMVQRDTQTGVCRQMRRVNLATTHAEAAAPTTPDSLEESEWDVISAPASGNIDTDTFVLCAGTSARPVRDAHVRCKICLCVMMGMELAAHEAQAHKRNDFGCSQCGKAFYTSRAVRKHSQDTGHAISTRFRYGTD